MTEEKQVYRCNVCGNIAEILHLGTGKITCCGSPMQLLEEKIGDLGPEKHIPIIEETENGVRVRVGSVEHPMEENHCIEWIELITDKEVYRKVLKPGEKPEAEFNIKIEDINKVQAREYCSVHSLWKSQ